MAVTLAIAFALTLPATLSARPDPGLLTPQQVWRGYDPRAEPLDLELLRQWTEGGARFREVYFTGKTVGDEAVRVYAIYAAPEGGSDLPAILHVHGGGQTVNVNWLKFWTGRGYAALTFNWGGEWPDRDKYTLWGPLTHANHKHAGRRLRATDPDVRACSWYEWALVTRRALTFLEQQPQVDPKRLGAFGVSMGGTIMWYLAGVDDRLQAGCAIYGVGWNSYRRQPKYALGHTPEPPDESTLRWRAGMAPEAYAPRVKCPMLFLSATNDQHGDMDRSYDTLDAIPRGVPRRQAFTSRFRHHIGADLAQDLPLWMDTWLRGGSRWPRTPTAKLQLARGGVPELRVLPDASQQVASVETYYALENPHAVNRYWRSAEGRRAGRGWLATLPVMDVDAYLFAFANVHYASGLCLSSQLQAAIPSKLGRARATDSPSLVMYDGSDGIGGWVTSSPGTDPLPPVRVPLHPAAGPGGRRGFTVFKHGSPRTHQLGDPKWRGPAGASLSFEVATRHPQEFVVAVHEREFLPGSAEYNARVSVAGKEDAWQTVVLAVDQLKSTTDGTPLENWDEVVMLELKRPEAGWSDDNIIFTDFRWLP